jgi:hypothetical protein
MRLRLGGSIAIPLSIRDILKVAAATHKKSDRHVTGRF